MEYVLLISFWRLDIIKPENGHVRYPKETYVLIIDHYYKKHIEIGDRLFNKRIEFSKLEDLLEYLDENNLVKRSDIIKEDARK